MHLPNQAGKEEEFAALFEQYKNLVYKTAYLMLDNPSEAEDALQEVFVLVYKGLHTFDRNKGAFTTWIHRITVNYCLNLRRKRALKWLTIQSAAPLTASESPGGSLAEEESIRQAIRELSDKQRAVVILRYYWELSYAEISQILDVPLGTVKSRLDLALRALRSKLQDPAIESEPASRKLEVHQ